VNFQTESQTIVRFGVFDANFRAGELRRNGVRVKIQDLPFRALQLLIERANQIVTRDDFRQALWPEDVFVDFDRAISSAVKRLRDALGDSADNPIFIETIDRRGYRWIAPITVASATSALVSSALVSSGSTSADPFQESTALSGATLRIPLTPPTVGQIPARYRLSPWNLLYLIPLLIVLITIGSFRGRTANANLHLHPSNQQAKDLYLQGRYYWSRRTPDDLRKAVDYFMQAIVHDPGYADAYVGLADCYNLLPEYTAAMRAGEAYPRARAAAAKAVELDDNSSQAHASLAFATFWGFWDGATSDHEFRRAIELDPNNAIAHHWYATTLQDLGRFPQALAQIERAQALDPTSRSILADKAAILSNMPGRQKEALELLQQMEKADPAFLSPHRYLRYIYLQTGDYQNYLKELREEAVLTANPSTLQIADASEKAFASGGAHAMFESLRREQEAQVEEGKLDPYALAQTCAIAGDKADALKYLKAAYDQHSQDLPGIGIDRAFVGLRDEPEFRELKAALKLPYAENSGQ
jgi:DNA-binding winged helix-turn-helix (wHTH) protein/Tfp pilus assembly protein PilF